MAIKKVLLIVSPVSRPTWVAQHIPHVKITLEDAGMEVEERVTREAGEPGRLAAEAKGVFDAVVVAGGDGSINEAMNHLCGSDTPVGIIPLGTVNVLAREIGIPLDPRAAARALVEGEVMTFDMGCMGERRFLLMASYGFDVEAVRKNPRFLKRLVGRYSYVLTGLFLYPLYRNVPIHVYVDGEETPHRAYFAIFSNGRRYAGEHVLAPQADMHDGLLDVVLFDCPGRLGLLRILLAILLGNHHRKRWTFIAKARRVRFETEARDLFQIDGDPVEPEGSVIGVERDVIRIIAPN
jgi:YegS/Rv2252/BmrU family lipid kinase